MRVRLIINVGILIESCCRSLVSEVTLFEASNRSVWDRTVENGRGAKLSVQVNWNSNLVRLWSLNCPLQKMMSVGAIFRAGYYVKQHDEALVDRFSKIWIERSAKGTNV